MHAMSLIARAVCVLSLVSLSACHWDDDDEAPATADTAAAPSATGDAAPASLNTTLVVEPGSTASTAAGTYVGTGAEASSVNYGGLTFITNAIETDPLRVGVSRLSSDASKYMVVAVESATGQMFACKGGSWRTDEVAGIKQALGTDLPACGAGVALNVSRGDVVISQLTLPSLAANPLAQNLVLSTALTLSSPTAASNTLPAVGTVEQTSGLPPVTKAFSITGGETSIKALGDLNLRIETQFTAAFNIAVAADMQDLSRYVLAVSKTTSDAIYACAGGSWTAEAKLAVEGILRTGVLPACPAAIKADVAQGVLEMTLTTLSTNDVQLSDESERQVILSANLNFTKNEPAGTTPAEDAASTVEAQ
jgi:hypothetical protein